MKYETIMQAYNAMKNMHANTLEARAQAINGDIAANPNADIQAYNIELEAIERVLEERRGASVNAQTTDLSRTAKPTEGDEDLAATPEYRSAFYKRLQGRELTDAERRAFDAVNVERRDNAFNTLSNSAAVIPTQTLNEIVTKARDMGGIMGIARGFAMPSNIAIPVATPTSAAQWHVEGQEVETEQAGTVPVRFAANEILKVLSISEATRTMSVSAFEAYLADELTASVMGTLAKGMVDGNGEGQATGIITGIDWIDAASASEGDTVNMVTVPADEPLGFAHILKTIAMLKRGYGKGAKFVMNNATLYADVYGIVDEVARPIYLADLVNGGPGRILGFEVEIDDYMPDHDIVFGNFNYYGYNLPSGIALDVSRESSFKSALVDYRGLAIADAKPIVAEAFARITKATE